MIQGNWMQACIAVLVTELILSFSLPFLTTNTAIIYLINDIVSAFVYAIVYLPTDRIHFYKNPFFHYLFSTTLVLFAFFSVIMLFLGF